jgi:hypothetical protein
MASKFSRRRSQPLKARRNIRSRSTGKTAARPKTSREKVGAFRARMRAKGMRLVQMWLPETRTAEFASEARRQARLANVSSFAAGDQAWVDAQSSWNID